MELLPFPPIPDELLAALDRAFPDTVGAIAGTYADTTQMALELARVQGQRTVVEFLRHEQEKQRAPADGST